MQSSISDYKKYKNVCIEAVRDDNVFNTFRSNNDYMGILEHVSYESGLEYYKHCLETNKIEFDTKLIEILKKIELAMKNLI